MIYRSFPFLLTALLLPLPASAEKATYQWRDSSGVNHFTDDSDSIPDRYLRTVKERLPVAAAPKQAAKPAAKTDSTTASAASTASSSDSEQAKETKKSELARQLEEMRKGVAAKKEELARLRHKWAVAKGRTPTAQELKAFEEKKKAGKATAADNPYVNKSALSVPAPRRAAYYKKLEEINHDEERIRKLEKELEAG
jgi:hypothetical protein